LISYIDDEQNLDELSPAMRAMFEAPPERIYRKGGESEGA
jgi:hypothetical protein